MTFLKVIIYMSMTANGYIAEKSGRTAFVRKASDESFRSMMSKVKANLVGMGTYKETLKHGRFPYDGFNVVMTRKPIKSRWKNVLFTDKKAENALKIFEDAGYKTVMAGGGKINSLFMKKGLVDEIYLDIEPIILTNGIKVFDGINFKSKLELLGVKRLSNEEVQLHYKVLK